MSDSFVFKFVEFIHHHEPEKQEVVAGRVSMSLILFVLVTCLF